MSEKEERIKDLLKGAYNNYKAGKKLLFNSDNNEEMAELSKGNFGIAAENIVAAVCVKIDHFIKEETQADRVNYLKRTGIIPGELGEYFYLVRKERNNTVHVESDEIVYADPKASYLMTQAIMIWGREFIELAPETESYYDILGVGRNANDDEIRRAKHNMQKKYHPDQGDGNIERSQKINEAFRVLINQTSRSEYDLFLDRLGDDYYRRVSAETQKWKELYKKSKEYVDSSGNWKSDKLNSNFDSRDGYEEYISSPYSRQFDYSRGKSWYSEEELEKYYKATKKYYASPGVIVAWAAIMLFPILFRTFIWKVPQHMIWFATGCIIGVAAIYGLAYLIRILDFSYRAGTSILLIIAYCIIVLAAILYIFDPQMKPTSQGGETLQKIDMVVLGGLSVLMTVLIVVNTYKMIKYRPLMSAVSFGIIFVAFLICMVKFMPSLVFTVSENDTIEVVRIDYYDNGDEMLGKASKHVMNPSGWTEDEVDNPKEAYKAFIGKHQLDSVELIRTVYEESEEDDSSVKKSKSDKKKKKKSVKKAIGQERVVYYVNRLMTE